MSDLIIKNTMDQYLSDSKYINWKTDKILQKADELKQGKNDEVSLIKNIFEYVRDEIYHSWDVQDERVTKSASEVLQFKVGICWAKSNLLAALLRACGIPTGICYQKLTLGSKSENEFCIHALNAIYIKSLDRWVRVDARGNKPGVDAQFNPDKEQLAFSIHKDRGEIDYKVVYANPSEKLMDTLEKSDNMLYSYLHTLPQSIFIHRKATIDDLDELVKSRITVLRAANHLSEDTDMSVVERESREYYKQALEDDHHVAYLVYDENDFVGAGGISFYRVMPIYHNPSGRKAYVMNMYTDPQYRRKGIAYETLDLLINEAKERSIMQISLEATESGVPLYEKYGFKKMMSEMYLDV